MASKLTAKLKKKLLPQSLFYRFILMVMIPMFLLQLSSLYIFFERYWDRNTRENISILLREIRIISRKYNNCASSNCNEKQLIDSFNIFSPMDIILRDKIENDKPLEGVKKYKKIIFFMPTEYLRSRLQSLEGEKVCFRETGGYYVIGLLKGDRVLEFVVNKRSLIVPRIELLIFWNVVSFLIIGCVAFLFVRNQVRSIEKLKDFASDFSYLEKDNANFKPSGATEIRETGFAMLNMVKKLKNLINTRTTMLAQISHDFRTPLTRMKLQTEFIDDPEIANFFRQDIAEMNRMIDEYLLFARGDLNSNPGFINIREFFNSIMADYKRGKYGNLRVTYNLKTENVYLKEDSFRRCINNLINNSLRYRRTVTDISVRTSNRNLIVEVEDDGAGLPKFMFSRINKPFFSTDGNRKNGTNGGRNGGKNRRNSSIYSYNLDYNGISANGYAGGIGGNNEYIGSSEIRGSGSGEIDGNSSSGVDGRGNGNNENMGLGLSIVQHVIDIHGGKVRFSNSKKLGGLLVTLIVPLLKK